MKIFLIAIFFLINLIWVSPVLAHVVVKPNSVGVAAYQTFTIGVPVEKDLPTVGMRLLVPEGVKSVTPNVKSGWQIQVKKEGTGDTARVTEISWVGGSIPDGQRDDFLFSAQVPANETTLQWKAYQTYQDGTIVAWDADPKAPKAEGENGPGPYSTTVVVNDLKQPASKIGVTAPGQSDRRALLMSGVALALSAVAIGLVLRRRA